MKFPLYFLYTILVFTTGGNGDENLNLTHVRKLSEGGFFLRWAIHDPTWITFEMSGPTKGYIAIGFSPNGKMPGSDIYIGWVDSQGNAFIKDYFATENGQPIEDPKQDAHLISASQVGNYTKIIFKRRWDTCDHRDFIISEDTMRLLWAWSEDDPYEVHGLKMIPYHERDEKKRGSISTALKSQGKEGTFPDEEPIYPAHVKHVDFTLSNIEVVRAETYFHCRILKTPKSARKEHIIAYRPLIETGSQGYIYQLSLFKCHIPQEVGPNEESVFEKWVDMPGGDCFTPDTPSIDKHCSQLVFTLAKGSEGFIFPQHIGQNFGSTKGPTYFRLQIHYENPMGKYLMDSSGVRVFYTERLREFESGVLSTGHRKTPFLTLPPLQKEFAIYGICSAQCTRNGIRPEGMKIVAVQFGMHGTGRKILLRHIRNGRELPHIAKDNSADFNHQNLRLLQNEVDVQSGDELITQCTFDTFHNNTFIFGGLSARRETCEAMIIYYPKSTLIECTSQPEFYQYFGALGIMNVTGEILNKMHLPLHSPQQGAERWGVVDDSVLVEGGRVEKVSADIFGDLVIRNPEKLRNRFVGDHMKSLHWTHDYFTKLVEQKWRNGPHYIHCRRGGGGGIIKNGIGAIPRFIEHLPPSNMETCAGQLNSSAHSHGQLTFKLIHLLMVYLISLSLFNVIHLD